jgi:UDP-N-acetylmuramyl pentapeptide phosphotransferase/UDP-N-acetylglucosamine-1-phosphate transferase
MTLAAAFVLGWFFVGLEARLLRNLGLGKRVREDGPESHLGKAGTPSMGGLAIALAAGVVWALAGGGHGDVALLALGFLFLGLLDDLAGSYVRPLKAREKLLLQLLFAGAFAYHALGTLSYTPWPALDFALYLLAIVGSANAMNFTDGLDGLAASIGAILLLPFLGLPLASAFGGALLGFLWHNAPPARIFMGDTGSQALGALVAGLYLAQGKLFYLPLAAIVPAVEVLSVIVQVIYFRKTGGRRIFRMAPLHHHFELLGWPEAKVVFRFAVITAAATALAAGLWGKL